MSIKNRKACTSITSIMSTLSLSESLSLSLSLLPTNTAPSLLFLDLVSAEAQFLVQQIDPKRYCHSPGSIWPPSHLLGQNTSPFAFIVSSGKLSYLKQRRHALLYPDERELSSSSFQLWTGSSGFVVSVSGLFDLFVVIQSRLSVATTVGRNPSTHCKAPVKARKRLADPEPFTHVLFPILFLRLSGIFS